MCQGSWPGKGVAQRKLEGAIKSTFGDFAKFKEQFAPRRWRFGPAGRGW